MNPSFWIGRWQNHTIGFHQHQINRHLQDFFQSLEAPPGSTMLVPLCGKSLDMLWLREQGYRVVGVELSEIAATAFFHENGIPFEIEPQNRFVRYRSDGIEILQGDFFAVQSTDIDGISSAYDRAALIAMPKEMRDRYARQMGALMPSGARTLLITAEYPEEQMSGPPFSVSEEEIRRIFGGTFKVRMASSTDALEENPRFKQRGITELTENVYILERC